MSASAWLYQVNVSKPGDLMVAYDVPAIKGYDILEKLSGETARLTLPAVSVTVPCRNSLIQVDMFMRLEVSV